MKSRKKIIFVIPSLKAGGAERIMTFVSQHLNSTQFETKMVVLGYMKDTVYKTEDLSVIYLKKSRLITAIPKLFSIFKKERPDIVIGSIVHINAINGFFSFLFKDIKFIGRESSVLTNMGSYAKISLLYNVYLIKFLYNRLDVIICQSEDMKKDFEENFHISSKKLCVINNPITNFLIPVFKPEDSNFINFITVGRLSAEKGYLRILKGLSTIKNYNFTYTIIGSGPLLEVIKSEAKKIGLLGIIQFIPYTNRVLEVVGKHDYFLQGSFVEGFPNSLLESCTTGTPVIAFNAPGGTKEIVLNGVNGFLVNTDQEFADLLSDLPRVKKIERQQVIDSVYSRFNSKKILSEYEDLFKSI